MAGSMAQWALGDLEQELASTRRVLERVPAARWEWRPHDKSWTLGQLATHLARIPSWPTAMCTSDVFDLATLPKDAPLPADPVAVLALFDANVTALKAAMATSDDALLQRPWTLRMGDHALMTLPTVAAIRMWGLSHQIHHRGQLTVYLRLIDAPVPGLYGPSADER